ncbi:MAG TPA: histidine--tRNA ligase [Candidatus Marinimicrobia bacterium]|jgi:histidyl-tRNA synthetase|nr:histidine--tRNA ligase [Candidatus Neomarinimicrobiota bacterium]MDP6276257.1 histidine--tRNA ligase [Candidatus Neomarinimicrobiota bacterium]MDP7330691.1 histidine--tRNA ligase [Candidatus Neomarinimicrobiota bacterium]HBN45258.1 histidine--tRNA ligase [Candidatus Neomarinimicrobiota bacterium]HJL75346.1 histidine--tRNA ligase [Candidatus Neomarinimicrobiota bacterium]|tara:strand:- start:35293 stop:36537 length:1245 start_codon:yes stop_codon:yes gene_type:complete
MAYKTIKGTHDILPDESNRWQELEKVIHEVAASFGYSEIRTPIFENTSLFARSVGEDTDIVSKEMYTWEDRSGGSVTLRPELTAPVARAYIQHNLGVKSPLQRLYYIGPLFRRERPQKGRQRQFHQFGIEAFGSEFPEQDAEIIAFGNTVFSKLGIKDVTLKLNSLGSGECRSNYKKALQDFLTPYKNDLSATSQKRLSTNPLRILDTKDPDEQQLIASAPSITDYWTADDQKHFSTVQELLKVLKIPFELDHMMVRGLDYYTRTTFEFISGGLGAQDAICGGGRYDNLVETLGGKLTPGIGFAAGMERILLSMNSDIKAANEKRVHVINLIESESSHALQVANQLREAGYQVTMDTLRRSLKAQMRDANRSGAVKAVIIGEEELQKNVVQVKDLSSGEQKEISILNLVKHFTV